MNRKAFSRVALSLMASATAAFSEIDLCRFNIGVDLTQASTKKCGYMGCTKNLADLDIPTGVDFVSKFTGHTDVGAGRITPAPQALQEGTFLSWAKTLNATPMYKTYIIAEGMKVAFNLDKDNSDCNQSASKTICTEAGAYFAQHRANIIAQYTAFAKDAATRWGTTKPMIWALEPDFYQYASRDNRNNNPLSFADAAKLIGDIADAVKAQMPNAQLSMDISPWAPESWFTSLPLSKFTYMNTSGGISQPYANIKGNEMAWARLKQLTNLPMIADDGYGAGGGLTSPNAAWTDINNIKARMNDGVIGLMEAHPTSAWTSTIATIHTQTAKTNCAAAKFTLSVTAGNGGSVSVNPTGTSFDAGATVKLKATPQAGYKFTGWTGGVTGSKDTITVVMNANMTITAGFATLPKYNLTINQSTGGNITANPAGSSFDSGTSVKLTATAQSGYTFSSWTSGATGAKDTATLVMNSNKTVAATFNQSIAVLARSGKTMRVDVRGDQLSVVLDHQGVVEFSLVSLDGKSVRNLGAVEMQGQEQIFGLGQRPVGLQYLRMRGEGWEKLVPMAAFSR